MSDSSTVLRSLLEYLRESGFEVTEEGEDVISLPIDAENGSWTAYGIGREQQRQLLFYSVVPETVPDVGQMALFVTRANFGLALGNFELDLDDGELRYKTSIDAQGAELSRALIEHLVLANFAVVNRYLPGIRAVAAGMDAALAIEAIEGHHHEHEHEHEH